MTTELGLTPATRALLVRRDKIKANPFAEYDDVIVPEPKKRKHAVRMRVVNVTKEDAAKRLTHFRNNATINPNDK